MPKNQKLIKKIEPFKLTFDKSSKSLNTNQSLSHKPRLRVKVILMFVVTIISAGCVSFGGTSDQD